jgi:hypothetical protein
MDTETRNALLSVLQEMEQLRHDLDAHRAVINAMMKIAIPHLPNTARLKIDGALRTLMDDQALPHTLEVNIAAMECGGLLPIHHPSWTGVPAPPEG